MLVQRQASCHDDQFVAVYCYTSMNVSTMNLRRAYILSPRIFPFFPAAVLSIYSCSTKHPFGLLNTMRAIYSSFSKIRDNTVSWYAKNTNQQLRSPLVQYKFLASYASSSRSRTLLARRCGIPTLWVQPIYVAMLDTGNFVLAATCCRWLHR